MLCLARQSRHVAGTSVLDVWPRTDRLVMVLGLADGTTRWRTPALSLGGCLDRPIYLAMSTATSSICIGGSLNGAQSGVRLLYFTPTPAPEAPGMRFWFQMYTAG